MPPTSKDPAAQVQYFVRLLAALCLQGDGEIVIDKKFIRQIEEEGSRQALVEETDCASDSLVLRYGSKHSAMYPVEPLCQSPQVQPSVPSPASSPQPVPRRPPPTIADLANAERRLRQARMAQEMKAEQRAAQDLVTEITGRQ